MLTCRLASVVRSKIGFLIEHWQRICLLTERIVRRREAAAVRLTPVMRTSFLPTHLSLPLPPFVSFSSSLSSLSSGHTSASGSTSSAAAVDNDADSSASILSGLTSGARHTSLDGQADLARLTNTMKSLVESNERCWRGEDCELCTGVRQGLVHVSSHTQRHADALEHRVSRILTYAIRRSVLTHSVSRGQCFTPLWSPSRSS